VKILALDIETSPNLAYVWSLWEQNVSLDALVDSGDVLCFAAKWLGEKRMYFYSSRYDKADMVCAAHALLDEADVVMHYNGKRFDIPHLNRLFVEDGLHPPSPYAQIDLLEVVRKRFKFPSNKLAYVAPALGLKGKVKHSGFSLWTRCLAGEDAAWKEMERYNRRDVLLLEELYGVLQPWVPNHPTHTLYDGVHGCPVCGKDTLQRRGLLRTKASVYCRWSCTNCGAWSRSTMRDSGTHITQAT
jgi:hypothetical protein